MGICVQFWAGRPDGIESAFLESLPSFRAWYEDLATDPTSGFELAPLDTIDLILRQGRSALLPTSEHDARVVDEVVDDFVGSFCDWGPGRHLFPPMNESMIKKERYESLSPLIQRHGDRHVSSFWHYLLHGRPLARDPSQFPYQPSDPVFRVSFITAEETALLREPMSKIARSPGGGLSEVEASALNWAAQAVGDAARQHIGLVVTTA